MGSKRALCVGINVYKNNPEDRLNGCVNDVASMTQILKKYMGFADSDITILTDEQATKINIINGLNEMVDGARSGKYDYLTFSMSSHGTQIADENFDEPDGFDEAFCPYDLAISDGRWDKAHIIVDDELSDILSRLPDNVLFEAYLDTCHSGTGLKVIELQPGKKARYIMPPLGELAMIQTARLTAKKMRSINPVKKTKGIEQQILWAACAADQTSTDAHLDNEYHGAFTYCFYKNVVACDCQLTRENIMSGVKNDIINQGFDQRPQLECSSAYKNLKLGEKLRVQLA